MNSENTISTKVEQTIAELSLSEKISALSGAFTQEELFEKSSEVVNGEKLFHYNLIPYPTGRVAPLDLQPVRFVDGPRGAVCGNSTCFPVSMARGASFDPDLEARIGEAIGREIRAAGGNYFGGVCINILRHPAAGRAQETYGEDMHHLGEMGAALVRGVQRHNVMACVKHYACNNIENSRFDVSVELDDRTLHEIYLPHFKRCVDEDAASIMGAYNRVRGDQCCESALLLQKILREMWGFDGFTISDFFMGVRSAVKAINAGLDIEMPCRMHYVADLDGAVQRGEVDEATIDESLRRILRTALRYELADDPEDYSPGIVCSREHVALAREAAQKSMVLLRNEQAGGKPALPINLESVTKLALVGQLADVENIGDHGSSRVYPPYIVTPKQGISERLKERGVELATAFDNDDVAAAKRAATGADAAIVVAGCTHSDEGEYIPTDLLSEDQKAEAGDRGFLGGDRESLRLKPDEIELIRAVAEVNDRVIVVLIGGSAFILEDVIEQVQAIVFAWYPGMEGGNAIADTLFGDYNPGGKLPFTIPTTEEHLAYFSNEVDEIDYDYYHGYMLVDKEGVQPRYPFGFGLSYSHFAYSNASAQIDGEGKSAVLRASVDVENSGELAGDDVAQLYIGFAGSPVERPAKVLSGFSREHLKPGERRTVRFEVPLSRLGYFDAGRGEFTDGPECSELTVSLGNSSAAGDLQSVSVSIR